METALYVVVGLVVIVVVWLFAGNLFNKNPVERKSPYIRGRWIIQDADFGQSEIVGCHDLVDGGIKIDLSNGGSRCYHLDELHLMDLKQAISDHNPILVYKNRNVILPVNGAVLCNEVQRIEYLHTQSNKQQLKNILSKDGESIDRELARTERLLASVRPAVNTRNSHSD